MMREPKKSDDIVLPREENVICRWFLEDLVDELPHSVLLEEGKCIAYRTCPIRNVIWPD